MLKYLLVTSIVFLVIDIMWLGFIAKNFYSQQLAVFTRTFNLPAAILTYFILTIGLVTFVINRFSQGGLEVFLWGALFGLVVYGVYDLTNLATLKDWPIKLVLVDILWGMFVCGTTAFIVTFLVNRFL
jgi:uncharacterized membrane protein